MLAAAENLSLAEFQAKYEKGDQSFEYWHGRAIPKGMPTWLHGLLQRIVMELLTEAGYIAGSEVELRIVADAHPKPDVIATTGDVEEPYPTKAVDVVVEILSPDDPMDFLLEKCRSYQAWGFADIYVVDPRSRLLYSWSGSGLQEANCLTSIPATRIWERLDQSLKRSKI